MKIKITPKDNKGAVLIISIIIGVVALAAGLTAASFVSRSTRNITDQESSIKALAIAESGVEKVLGLSDVATYVGSCPVTDGTSINDSYIPTAGAPGVVSTALCFFQEDLNNDSIADQSYYLEVTSKGGSSTYTDSIQKDSVLEINTLGLGGKTIRIAWQAADMSVADADKKYASLLISEIYGSGALNVKKYAYNPNANYDDDATGQSSNGFTPATFTSPNNIISNIPISSEAKIIRIKPLYFNVSTITVIVNEGTSFTTDDQGIDIYATGCTCANVLDVSSRQNSSVRKVKVTKSREHLPAIFDYVLYSGSQTVPLTK